MPTTQETAAIAEPVPTTKSMQLEAAVHERLRRRVGAENAIGGKQSIGALAARLISEGLDRLPPVIRPLPPAA